MPWNADPNQHPRAGSFVPATFQFRFVPWLRLKRLTSDVDRAGETLQPSKRERI